jgi:hypothetical protein
MSRRKRCTIKPIGAEWCWLNATPFDLARDDLRSFIDWVNKDEKFPDKSARVADPAERMQ